MGDHAGWDTEYNLQSVKLNFLVVMGMARIFPEEEGAKNVRDKRYFTLCLQGIWSSLITMWEAKAKHIMPEY